MKFHGPAAVLLGSLMLCSSTGCSIAGALFTDFRPTTALPLKSSDRMLVIGKVFEQQGRTERARALYRAALRQNPTDAEARRLLAGLGPAPQPAGSSPAVRTGQQVLVADTKATPPQEHVSPGQLTANLPGAGAAVGEETVAAEPESTPAQPASFTRAESGPQAEKAAVTDIPVVLPETESAEPAAEIAPLELAFPEPAHVESAAQPAAPAAAELLELSGVFAADAEEQAGVEIIEVPADVAAAEAALFAAPAAVTGVAVEEPAADTELVFPDLTDTVPTAPAAAVEKSVPEAEVPAAETTQSSTEAVNLVLTLSESPDEHSEQLVEVLLTSESMEARCLAAALLGECSQDDYRVGDALKQVAETTEDESLLLATADSQLHRRELGAAVARRLIGMLPDSVPAVQVQLITMLRNFRNTECDGESNAALRSMLTAADEQVRTTVVLTLADFSSSTAECMEQIRDIEANDPSEMVRSAAGISLARMESSAAQSR